MESEISTSRWAIPRPSLTCSVSSVESGGGRKTRGRSPTKSRGSASSQGSASNHSTHSASSGSLLLSAANLSQMNATPSRQHNHRLGAQQPSSDSTNYKTNLTAYVHTARGGAVTGGVGTANPSYVDVDDPSDAPNHHADPFWRNVKLGSSSKSQRVEDAESVASSTHFTVVNGFTRHNKGAKGDGQMWCCKSSHQITVLVVTMTILFTAGILAAICYVEMRQRRDIGSRFS